jgi:hypothetical protein
MPKKSNKSKVIDSIFRDAVIRLQDLGSSDESEEDSIHEDLIQDVEMVCDVNQDSDEINKYLNISKALACYIGYSVKVPKQTTWLNDILPGYDDSRFKQAIRISRKDFQKVLELIQNHHVFNTTNSQIPVSVQLAVALYRFGTYGTGSSLSAVARIFGLGDGSTVVRFTRRIIQVNINVCTK